VAASLLKSIWILFERAAASLVKRLGYFTQGCGHLSSEGYFNLFERAADPLVERYSYFTQECSRPSCEGYFNFM
jgi:hypothetical protein